MSTLYVCLTCGFWRVLNFMESAFAVSGNMKPLCPDCKTLMHHVQFDEKVQLMEEKSMDMPEVAYDQSKGIYHNVEQPQ